MPLWLRLSYTVLSMAALFLKTKGEENCPTRVPGSEAKCSQAGSYKTFDGANLHYNGSSRYILTRPCDGLYEDKLDTEIYTHEWSVEVQNKAFTLPSTNKEVFYGEIVQILAYNHVIQLREFGEITIDKQEPILPINLKEGKITVFRKGWAVILNTDFGLQVSFDARGAGGQHIVEIQMHNPDFACRLCGICGTWNGNRDDDLVPKNGKSRVIDYKVIESWETDNIIGTVSV